MSTKPIPSRSQQEIANKILKFSNNNKSTVSESVVNEVALDIAINISMQNIRELNHEKQIGIASTAMLLTKILSIL
jgi:CRISPR/Cas system-associated protein Csm6